MDRRVANQRQDLEIAAAKVTKKLSEGRAAFHSYLVPVNTQIVNTLRKRYSNCVKGCQSGKTTDLEQLNCITKCRFPVDDLQDAVDIEEARFLLNMRNGLDWCRDKHIESIRNNKRVTMKEIVSCYEEAVDANVSRMPIHANMLQAAFGIPVINRPSNGIR